MRALAVLACVLCLCTPASAAVHSGTIGFPVSVKLYRDLAAYPQLEIPASVISLDDSKISAEVSAKIIAAQVQVGDAVSRGAVLFRLDARDFEISLEHARASLNALEARRKLARSQLERAASLVQKNFISRDALNQRQAEFEATTAEFLAQRARITEIERNIEKCTVRAPFSGIVKARPGQVGEMASPGQPLVNLVNSEQLEVSAQIQPALVVAFKRNDAFQFVAHGDAYPLRLRALTPLFDARERSREARFVFAAKKAAPGESGVLRWQSNQPHIPANLLVERNGKLGVFVKQDNLARFVELHGAETGRPAASDLPQQTPIIVDGRFGLNDGDRVR